MRKLLILAASFCLTSCVTMIESDKLSESEKAYINEVKSAKTSFVQPKSNADEIWSRGINFISKYSGMKIQNSSDFLVETFHPESSDLGTTGYKLNKLLNGNEVTFQIECLYKRTNMKFTKEVCQTNEQILSLYG